MTKINTGLAKWNWKIIKLVNFIFYKNIAMNIQNLDNGFLIDEVFAYGCDNNYPQYINLKKTIWDEMNYKKSEEIIIDFPWEYDVRGLGIEVIEEKDLLHFIISKEDLRFAIISHKKALSNENVNETITSWILTDEALKEHLEKNELEWDIFILE